MTTDAKPRIKITYATLRNDNEELHALYEQGVQEARAGLGAPPPELHRRPLGRRLRGHLRGPLADRHATSSSGRSRRATARTCRTRSRPRAAPRPAWRHTPWQERLAILRRAAEFISERQMRYGADMAFEVGKNRLEALGEVEEAADLIRYYAQTAEDNDFYDHPMDNLGDAAVHTRSILRPHGVFAVISPFNFPMALVGGPGRRRAPGRQHRGLQAGVRVAAVAA